MSGGYSWTNTSQWSQIPTTPVDQSSQQAAPQSQAGGYNQPPQNQNSNFSPATSPQEPRRDMITRLYKEILGREPDNAGLNYYLFNTSITELQIAKEMYESTEHQGILNKSKDVRDMILKLEEYNRENSELKTKLQNAESLNANYKILLDQKTQIINSMKSSGSSIPSEQPFVQNNDKHAQSSQQHTTHQDGLTLEDPFADEPRRGKGCIGWIKNLFSFS